MSSDRLPNRTSPRAENSADRETDSFESADSSLHTSAHRRRWRWFALMGVAFALFIWFVPALLLGTSLRNPVIHWFLPDLAGQLQVESIRAGWLSPLRAERIVVRPTGDQQPLAKIESIETQRTLFALLCSPSSPGTLRIHRPSLRLQVREEGSNLEDFLKPWLKTESSDSRVPQVALAWSDGDITLLDETGQPLMSASAIQGRFQSAPLWAATSRPDAVYQFQIATDITTSPTDSGAAALQGRLEAEGQVADENFRRGWSTVKADRISLAALAPVWRRIAPDTDLAAIITTACRFDWDLPAQGNPTIQKLQIEKLEAQNVQVKAPEMLGPDTLRIPQLIGAGDVRWDHTDVHLKNVQLVSDLATIRATGAIGFEQIRAATVFGALFQAAQDELYDIHAEVNLAALAGTLPAMFRIRDNMQITSGSVEVSLRSRAEVDAATQKEIRRYEGSLNTSDLSAVSGGRKLTWQQPIDILFAARQGPKGAVIEQLHCESSFLQCQASGTIESGNLVASCDLNQLTTELARFMQLDGWQLSGEGGVELQWRVADRQRVAANGQMVFEELRVQVPGWEAFEEDRLTTHFLADLQLDPSPGPPRVRAIDKAAARMVSGSDELTVQLDRPVPLDSPSWPLDLNLQGNVASWKARCQPLFTLPDWRLAGAAQLSLQGEWSEGGWKLVSSLCELQDFEAESATLFIREPRITAEASGAWQIDEDSNRWVGGPSILASSSLAFRCDDLRWEPASNRVTGNVGYRTDLERVQRIFKSPPAYQMFGQVEGHVSLQADAKGAVVMDGEHTVAPFELVSRSANGSSHVRPASTNSMHVLWREPQVKLVVKGKIDSAESRMTLEPSSLEGSSVRIQVQGHIDQEASVSAGGSNRGPRLDVTGQVTYDLAALAEQLRPTLGPDLQIAGRETRAFRLQGPLWPEPAETDTGPSKGPMLVSRQLQGSASLGWEKVSWWGVQLPAGELAAQLEDAVLQFAPFESMLSQGRFRLDPRVELVESPRLRIARGRVVDQMQITPEMCRTWLKYVAPLLADATRAEGKFSAELSSDATVPLFDPQQSGLEGQLIIHDAEIGPGPLAQQFIALVDQLRAIVQKRPVATSNQSTAWIRLPEQRIACQLTQGRVHHRGLRMQTRDVVIRTSGSVGVDQSLSLVAEMTIPDSWIGNDRLLASLRGQVIRVPVTGTVTKPRLDTRALDDLARQMAKSAAANLLDDQLRRLFEN